ncbi:MAG: ABC transporter permease [Chloroflexi bacterium]|nr:ABC transporter permease [Chloroflexota bacterium]
MATLTDHRVRRRRWLELPVHHQQRNVAIIWALLALLIVVASILSPHFLSQFNLNNIVNQSAALMLVSLGQTFVLLTAGIDLSVGSTISVVVTVLALTVRADPLSIALAVPIALGVGAIVGLGNGLLITRLRIPPFMVTLATLSIGQGIAYQLRTTPPGVLPREYSPIFLGEIGPIPIPILLIAGVTLAAGMTLRHTRFGRHVYAIGSSEAATRLSGMSTDRIKVAVYVLSGLTAGLAGAFMAARSRAGDPLIGQPFAFDAITAVVLGGVSLFGGRGSVYGVVAAVFIIAILSNLLNLLGISSHYQYILKGGLLIVAVMLYYRRA